METKRFVAPGGWFALDYPAKWCESDTTDDPYCFCFCDPNVWSGNFFISVSEWETERDCEHLYRKELRKPGAQNVTLGRRRCVANHGTIVEGGETYENYVWTTARGRFLALCSFTTKQGGSPQVAEAIIATLDLRDPKHETYPRELIPLRICEQVMIEEGYLYIVNLLKKCAKKGFTCAVADIPNLQWLIDKGIIDSAEDADWAWEALCCVFGAIVENEVDGVEWVSAVANGEDRPSLFYPEINLEIDLFDYVVGSTGTGKGLNLQQIYDRVLADIEAKMQTR